ncbi:nitrous oxide reductase accessory protein NosL [Rhodobacter sp. Har01]|uniref:nitrous oxide reductase accessory protein NosL n=1 Tax=Rhodobacter sp. Har01 TaxID=2883999 RepID=UPI001D08B0F9|nr:nitrous oxide reductase accessory protein NosL [Rhodobacter sp. Har01]MCB6177982.1 nitrous oxide reductase accessory protein NosL [Rhodobacter sp. Har01]
MKRALLLILFLTACKQDAQDISPVALTEQAVGHYCQMDLLEHPGPKAQVHLEGLPAMPLFFSQVRDAVAYSRLPEQDGVILAIYVNDMGAPGATWEIPGATNWIPATTAHYVMGSRAEGGMGAPELVPFVDLDKAAAFAAANGGSVVALAAVPDAAVIAPVALDGRADPVDDADYDQRLKSLSDKIGG